MALYNFLFAVGTLVQAANLVLIMRSRDRFRACLGAGVWSSFLILSLLTLLRQGFALYDLPRMSEFMAQMDNRVFPFAMSMLFTVATVLIILKLNPQNRPWNGSRPSETSSAT